MPGPDCLSLLTAMWKTREFLKITLTAKTAYELVLQNEMKPEYIAEQIREMCRLLNPKGINIDYFDKFHFKQRTFCGTSTTNVTIIWRSGILKTGE